MKSLLLFVFTLSGFNTLLLAQFYPPAAGQPGSTAIYKDSSVFINWASGCKITRGYQNISAQVLGFATVGDSSMATEKAQTNGIVSLGDEGYATCTFPYPIANEAGFDFAVFENGFDDYFLELAFVEVSSDGVNFFRFASHSLSDTIHQCDSFDSTEATNINNLAGKYRGGYGTPFDLQELAGEEGLDVNQIKYVKVIDVVGSLNPAYASRDGYQRKVNDPWPTPWPSGGFDLDAIGVLHQNTTVGRVEYASDFIVSVYPNPVETNGSIRVKTTSENIELSLMDLSGKERVFTQQPVLMLHDVAPGIYVLKISSGSQRSYKKIQVQSSN